MAKMSLLKRAWRWCFRPRSTDPKESFREQSIRIALVFLLLTRSLMVPVTLTGQQFDFVPLPDIAIVVILVIPILMCFWFLHQQQITLSGIMVVVAWTIPDLFGAVYEGYWLSSVQLSFIVNLVIASLVLPLKVVIPYGTLLIISFDLAIYNSVITGQALPTGTGGADYSPVTTGIIVSLFMTFILILNTYLKGQLNSRINMLSDLVANLEVRVSERTRDLQLSADVAQQVTRQLDLNTLLPELVEKTRAAFNLYFVSVFIFDETSQKLILQAGTGDAGKAMLKEGAQYHLEARPSLVAQVGRSQTALVINDVDNSERHAENAHLPNTKSEAVLPMMVGNRFIGVLGLQSEVLNRFQENDVAIFTTLAEQIAIAIRNAQLYAKQQQLSEELRQADVVKTQFFASVSHELRTPLNGIMNFTEMISSGMMGDVNNDQKELLEQSLDSSRHLLNLINDVLDISKIQDGNLKLFIEDNVDIRQELESVINLVKPLLNQEKVALVEEIDDELPLLNGDRRRIRQILLNLVSNAAKFTSEGMITISAQNQTDHVLLTVTDTGMGIPKEMQSIIFDPFTQTIDGVKQAQGTGLGLPIAKSLVEAHDGRIWLESTVGQGTTFYVTLPIQTAVSTTNEFSKQTV